MTVEVVLLDDVTTYVAGRQVAAGPAKQRCVLAALAMEPNRVLPAAQLAERVWGADPPRRARETLASYVSRLRRLLTAEVVARSGGYLLAIPETAVDVHRFRALCARARAAEDDVAAELFEQAMALWHGHALGGLDSDWATRQREQLDRELFDAVCDHADLRLRSGREQGLVTELAARAADHPWDERVSAQYMLALYRAGRGADALGHYRSLRDRLAEQLGTDPAPRTQELHTRILNADPALAAPRRDTANLPPPRQVPAAPAAFVGRDAELAALDAAVADARGGAVILSSIAGAGGIGKTWLALNWARRNAHRFPDGQLFVDLCGFSPSTPPMEPATALRGFLETLGIAGTAIPSTTQAMAGLYRSVLADRKMLVVLDNAADSAQVVPLLPAGSSCVVVLTSRRSLTELVIGHGARPLPLDVLSPQEARRLLVTRLGPGRPAAEPGAVDELLAYCSGYPLALGIVAGRAAVAPRLSLAALAAELRETDSRLDALDDGVATSLPAVLRSTYDTLPVTHARLFALLGLAPGPDIAGHAAAALARLTVSETQPVLRALEQLHLVEQHVPGRWRLHDLIRLFAIRCARRDVPAGEQEAALARLVEFSLHTAAAAGALAEPLYPVPPLDPPRPGCEPRHFAGRAEAVEWFTVEMPNLHAAFRLVADRGWGDVLWRFAWSLDVAQRRQGRVRDRLESWRAALAAVAPEEPSQVRMAVHASLGHAAAHAGNHGEAGTHLTEALRLAEQSGDVAAQARTHVILAQAYGQQDDPAAALAHARTALRLHDELDLPQAKAVALNSVGWYHARLGQYEPAQAHCAASLQLIRRLGHPTLEPDVLDSLGFIADHTGEHQAAVGYYRQAVTAYLACGGEYFAADTLERQGRAHEALGDRRAARDTWSRALAMYRQQHREAAAGRLLRLL
ncbi:BTAD domain-containing putative transcriptional regulator [Amycolatopsis sp. lyj-109]|uniref:AfsR/SARP family transcriptional regulator n=1 Tax=Amycolatopsis sp. lyj-109 TaxID=2789287 RepID=UPI00397B9743